MLNSELVFCGIGDGSKVSRFAPPALSLNYLFFLPGLEGHLDPAFNSGDYARTAERHPQDCPLYKPAAVTTSRTTVVSQVRAHTHPDHLDHLDMIPN